MSYPRTLLGTIVSATVATIALTSFAIVSLGARSASSPLQFFELLWPLVLLCAVAVTLVMSLLYRTLLEVIQELQGREEEARHAALHDPLSGLPNRALLEDRLDHALRGIARTGGQIAVLMLDLDRFKRVNDTHGHIAGDLVIQQTAERLKAELRDVDTVARVGGDEFIIIQSSPRDLKDVRRLCERISRSLEKPYHIGNGMTCVGASLGAVLVDQANETAAELLRHADLLMYGAKSRGRGRYHVAAIADDPHDPAISARAA